MSSTEVAGALARRWLKERRRSAARFEYLLSQPATGAGGDGGGALLERLAFIDALRTSVAACCALTCEARAAAAAAAAAATAAAAAAAAASAVGTGGAAVAGGGGPRLLSRLAIVFEEELQLMVGGPRCRRTQCAARA
jgi:hypothetical protein